MITESLDFARLGKLTFFDPDYKELPCLRLALDATLPSGEKMLCTGWFYGADLTPCYAEFSQDGKLLVSARITYFTFEAAPDGA